MIVRQDADAERACRLSGDCEAGRDDVTDSWGYISTVQRLSHQLSYCGQNFGFYLEDGCDAGFSPTSLLRVHGGRWSFAPTLALKERITSQCFFHGVMFILP